MKKTPEEIVIDIQDACKELGWQIAMNDSSSGISGLIIGQQEYVENVVGQLEDIDEYSIFSYDQVDNTSLH